jgi:hypothetical protein
MEPAMGQIIDFQTMKCEFLRRKPREATEFPDRLAARLDWLNMCGVSLADQVRASLAAAKTSPECTSFGQKLLFLSAARQGEPVV